MRYLQLFTITVTALALVSCNRDPNYLKAKYLESGNKYYEQKRLKEASIMYRKALDKDHKFGTAWYRLAKVDLDQQRVPDAYQALRRAYSVMKPNDPDIEDTTLKLVEIMLLASRQGGQAAEFLKEIPPMVDGLLAHNPSSWAAHKLKGDLQLLAATIDFKAGKFPEGKQEVMTAIQEYRTALSAKPSEYIASMALARTLVLAGETGEAEAIFKGLIDKNKANINGYYELYHLYINERKFPEAEAVLKKAITVTPKDASLRFTLAEYYWTTKRQDEFVGVLNDMKKDLKSFPQVYWQAGDFYSRVGQYDNALKQYEEGIKKDSANKSVYLHREIEVYVRQGNVAKAQGTNEQILKDDPKDPDARGMKATLMLDKGEVNQALADLQSVVTARPGNWVARFNYGRAFFAKGDYESAGQQFDKCIEINPQYLPARLAQTQVAILKGNFDAAIHDADEILKLYPASIEGRVMKAAALDRANRYDEARKLLNDVLEKNPKQVETLLELGVLDLNQKKNKDAMEHFRRAYEAAPTNIRGLLGESRALLLDGQPDKSVDLIRQASVANPASTELQRELGNAQLAARQFDPAIATFQNLLAKTSDVKIKGDLWGKIGECYRYKGDFPKSIEMLELAAQALPENTAIATNLALLYEAGGNLPKARANYEKAIKLDGNNPLALNNLAFLLSETNGNLDIALTYATTAKQRLPNFLEVSDTIGWIYLKKSLFDSAIDEFRRLTAQAPQNPIYHYHYAMALNAKGDRLNAKAECLAALQDHPAKRDEDQIRALLAKL